jgi:hypothetical protein
MISATEARGKPIRLRAEVRTRSADWASVAALAVSVNRGPKGGDYFSMADRPIREPNWREYVVEGNVAPDAQSITIMVVASGAVVADFDALRLEVRNTDGVWTELPIKDGSFEESDDKKAWNRFGDSKFVVISRPDEQARHGRRYLRVAAPTAGTSEARAIEAAGRVAFGDSWIPTTGASADFELGGGIKARVPLALTDLQARQAMEQPTSELQSIREALLRTPGPTTTPDVDARLADVIVAWNVFRHFYPYWSEVKVDWDTRLRPQLEAAYLAQTREAERAALRLLVADASDGHGFVTDSLRSDDHRPDDRPQVPIRFTMVGETAVISASGDPSAAPVGAAILSIEGVPFRQKYKRELRFVSGSEQWRRERALIQLSKCTGQVTMNAVLDFGDGKREREIPCNATRPPIELRPQPVTELSAGIWYVDLTRAPFADLKPRLDNLAKAKAVIFDARGSSMTDSGYEILPYLIESEEHDRWMHVAKVVTPFRPPAGWQDFGWDLKPAHPSVAGRVIFLTDERALSYPESVMGYIADRKLGVIVGRPTAGTNGDVATIRLPGGFDLFFTGRRVTRHDGHSPFHLIGVKPDVAVNPTVAGLRAARDEVLERAIVEATR